MKQGILRKATSLILVLSVLVCWLPWNVLPVRAADAELSAMLEEQIRDYAASIKQDNSDEAAAWLLARHGITEQGAMLVADGAHPLTALLMNAELTQASFVELLTEMVSAAQQFEADRVYANGGCTWSNEKHSYSFQVSMDDPSVEDPYSASVSCDAFPGETNGYDTMLKWLAGEISMEISLEKAEVREKTVAYDVHVRFSDHFVFDPNVNTGSISIALLALLTSTMFVDYDWEASAAFELEVPHSCTHQVPNYHWTYDAEQDVMTSDTSGGCIGNEAKQVLLEDGTRYYKLERDLVLRHTDPWVMEYSVKDPNTFAFSAAETKDTESPYFLNYGRQYLFFTRGAADGAGADYYGTSLLGAFRYNTSDTYTVRLENVISDDGSNMVWVTVRNDTLESVVLESTAMDDHYVIENGFWIRKEAESSGLSGMDFTIRYIGNQAYGFDLDVFDLSVRTMGQSEDGQSWFTSVLSDPTCEEQGFTAHTCAMCGYTYKDSWVEPIGHNWGEWEIVKEPTDTDAGLQQRTCAHCGKAEEEIIPRLGILCGDLDGNGRVNSLDLILLRQHLAGWDVTVDMAAADVNGNGTVNSLDLILLRQHLAGWDVTLGP